MISIQPTDAVIGAKVSGISLAEIPDAETINDIEYALEKYGVLIFPDQEISPEQQVAFSAAFAQLELTEVEKARLQGVEEIFVVGNVGGELVTFAPRSLEYELEWHTDHIHHEVAARASMLYAKQVPNEGGDTLFACMYYAYDSLTEAQKVAYCKMETINSAAGLERYLAEQSPQNNQGSMGMREYKRVLRPLVRAHPLTARRALYFGNQITIGIVGQSDAEAETFIKTLTQHACQNAFQYRHKWTKGDVVLWDNRRVLHAGTPYDVINSRRLLHRTTWRESEPITLVGD